MKRLFILGNGFDIAHGIESTYSHFGEYLEKNNPSFFENLNIAFHQDGHLWQYFEAVLPDCGTYIEEQGLQMGEDMIGERDYEPMDDMGIGVWLQEQYDFISMLPGVLRMWVESIDINKQSIFKTLSNNDMYFTFNYTDTLEKLYGIENVLHIHGDVGSGDTLIMGHGDRAGIEAARKDIHRSQYEFCEYAEETYKMVLRFLESTFKDTNEIIRSHLDWFEQLTAIEEVYILGLSLGRVDLPYLVKMNEIIPKTSNWYICYYHDEKEKSIKAKEEVLYNIGIKKVFRYQQDRL